MDAEEIAVNVKKKEKRKSKLFFKSLIYVIKKGKGSSFLTKQKGKSLFLLIGVKINFNKRKHGIFWVDIGMSDGRIKSQRISLN